MRKYRGKSAMHTSKQRFFGLNIVLLVKVGYVGWALNQSHDEDQKNINQASPLVSIHLILHSFSLYR